jgi:hypothetical protein
LPLRLAAKRLEAENVACLEFVHARGGRLPSFSAGAYITLDLPTGRKASWVSAGALNDGRSLREIAAAPAGQGHVNRKGAPHAATSIVSMLGDKFKGDALKRTPRGKLILAAAGE